MLCYDIDASKLSIVMELTCILVSNITDPVAQHTITSIKYSMIQLFVSQQVDTYEY